MTDKMIEYRSGSDSTPVVGRKPYQAPHLVALDDDLVQAGGNAGSDGGGFSTGS